MGLQPGHPHLLLNFVGMLHHLLFAAPHSTFYLCSKHTTSSCTWHPAFSAKRVGVSKPVAIVLNKLLGAAAFARQSLWVETPSKLSLAGNSQQQVLAG